MKKNGFTLVELLAVVSIISILLLLVAPKIANQLNNSKNDVNDVTKKIIYGAAEKYIKDNNMKIEYDYCLSVEELQDKEYLSDTITDNKLGLDISKKSVVITPKDNSGYEYELVSECNTATGEDYRGYYADVDGDGTVDGIIYADLAYDESGQWASDKGAYSYSAQTGLKKYIISNNTYKRNDGFGEKEIISVKKGSTGNARFYVMALEDFREGSFEEGNSKGYESGKYYWYFRAYGRMPDPVKDTSEAFGTGYANTGTMIRIWNNNGVEEGWTSGATQDNYDIFKHIQTKYQKGWYILSKEEWATFGDYFTNKTDSETKLTTSNYYSTYELSVCYWSSSLSEDDASSAWAVCFDPGENFGTSIVDGYYNVRLGATF